MYHKQVFCDTMFFSFCYFSIFLFSPLPLFIISQLCTPWDQHYTYVVQKFKVSSPARGLSLLPFVPGVAPALDHAGDSIHSIVYLFNLHICIVHTSNKPFEWLTVICAPETLGYIIQYLEYLVLIEFSSSLIKIIYIYNGNLLKINTPHPLTLYLKG